MDVSLLTKICPFGESLTFTKNYRKPTFFWHSKDTENEMVIFTLEEEDFIGVVMPLSAGLVTERVIPDWIK